MHTNIGHMPASAFDACFKASKSVPERDLRFSIFSSDGNDPDYALVTGVTMEKSVMASDLLKARELFLHAVGKLPPEQWASYIAEACGDDTQLANK